LHALTQLKINHSTTLITMMCCVSHGQTNDGSDDVIELVSK